MRRTPVLLLIAAVVASADPPLGDDWKYDVVYRNAPKNAAPLKGLILEKTDTHVILRCVVRKAGSPTITIRESVPLREVGHIEALGPEDREVLVTRLKNLAKERETLSAHLKALDPLAKPGPGAADRLTLTATDWVQKDRGPGLEYATPHFRLVSNSREAVVQLVALQLEQVYTAYQQSLPPRPKLGQATRILLTGTRADYQALVMARGGNFLNPAFYDVERNEIVCHSEIERLHDELEKAHKAHARALADLDDRAEELKELYKGKVPEPLAKAILDEQDRVKAQEKQNAALFELGKQRLFVRLYHEAFHAYLANFVFPADEAEVPRWLNEGLAQIFETAIVEAGDLRVGHIDKGRYETIRTAAGRGTVLPLADLLRSKERDFLVAHAGDKPASDRTYLAAWALAHYLTFERKVLGTPALEAYGRELKRGGDPLGAFRDLVGQPLEAFEKDFHGYLRRLGQDGTAGR